ncbi:MAG: helix-turn-helix transcriptional regulator [Candidatus Aminicenantes bacterium]|jgi:DNA-binding PadR family transcriptional regulator
MKFISRSEELILLSILKLRNEAYVVAIREELKKMTGETWALGALFVTLDRMSRKGYVQSWLSEPKPERGGRRKRLYRLLPAAVDALNEVRRLQTSIWRNVSPLSKEDLA